MIILKIIAVAFLTWLVLEIIEETIKTVRRNKLRREIMTDLDLLIAEDELNELREEFTKYQTGIKKKTTKKSAPSKKKTKSKKSR